MNQAELDALYEEYRTLPTDDQDTRLKKVIRYYVTITESGGKTINWNLESNDTATDFVYHMKRCGITVLRDPAFADLKTEFCVIIFYPKA